MKRILCILLLMPAVLSGQGTDTVNLLDCFRFAITNYPLYKQKEMNAAMNKMTLSNISKSWYPKISVNGQATYQSDVIGIGNFTSPHDQYKVTLDISQQLYDGGLAKNRREIENSNLDVRQQQLELNFHELKQQVSSVFFSINIIKKNIDLIALKHDDLIEKLNTIRVSVRNGALLPENEYILRAEILKTEQQADELQNKLNASIDILSELTGRQITADALFQVPFDAGIDDSLAQRPEILLFNLEKTVIDNKISLSKKMKMPKFFVYTQAGYGKPGLNMLSDKFDTYYIVGAGLKWDLIDWGEARNMQKIGNLRKEIINLNKENFSRNITIATRNELASIEYYKSSIERDKEIIELRTRIKESAFAQLQNGTITATEYLTEANAALQARQLLETHRILLVQSVINYQLINGDI